MGLQQDSTVDHWPSEYAVYETHCYPMVFSMVYDHQGTECYLGNMNKYSSSQQEH